MEYQVKKDALLVNGQTMDGLPVNGYWIPVKKNPKIETITWGGYRYIVVDNVKYKFHRSIDEIGRPHLFKKILEIMSIINTGKQERLKSSRQSER